MAVMFGAHDNPLVIVSLQPTLAFAGLLTWLSLLEISPRERHASDIYAILSRCDRLAEA